MIEIPPGDETVTMGSHSVLSKQDKPVIPFVEGDGTGSDIWKASRMVIDDGTVTYGFARLMRAEGLEDAGRVK